MTSPIRFRYLLAAALQATLSPVSASERSTVWDLTLGTSAADLPHDFVDFACGSNGGPPGLALAGFADYASCPAEPNGLHEVYFRYNDEQEYIARALNRVNDIERYRGTRVYGIDAIVSALFDAAGMLDGIRIVSDPRGVSAGDRNDQWRLSGIVMGRFGPDGWTCTDAPLTRRQTSATSFFVNRTCSKATGTVTLTSSQQYYHQRGQSFTDEFGKVQPTFFVSVSRFEMLDSSAKDEATAP